jgi:hypothetical protein
MAIYLLHVKAFSRAKGGRGTRAAAYRARERWGEVLNEALKTAGFTTQVDHRGARARGANQEPVPLIPQKILYMERKSVPTKAGDDIRRRYRERVEARLKGPGELERSLKAQRAENRQRIAHRSPLEASPAAARFSRLERQLN